METTAIHVLLWKIAPLMPDLFRQDAYPLKEEN